MNKKQTTVLTLILWGAAVFPQVSFAAFDKIKGLLRDFKSILDLLIPITFALALIFFFWGLAQFIRSVSDKTIAEGKNKMIWGIIALFVMISIWGIIGYIGDSLGIKTGISGGSTTGGIVCDPDKPANLNVNCTSYERE